eukprot:SAG25_NODE_14242_length_257_cov_0.879747_2_plen_44_part_01
MSQCTDPSTEYQEQVPQSPPAGLLMWPPPTSAVTLGQDISTIQC